MNVQKATSQVRKENWMKIISDCNASNLSIKDYCLQNSINEGSYYYWLKKIRKEVIASSNVIVEESNAVVPMLQTLDKGEATHIPTSNLCSSNRIGMVITTDLMKIEFDTNASNEMIIQVIRELKNA